MVSFWPWRKEDSSPASFERTLSALSAKIAATQTQLDKARSSSRRIKLVCTLYLGFAYLVYSIVLILVVGWKQMGSLEWTGMAGFPVLIYLVRTVTTAFFDYRINTLSARLKVLQVERSKTIQKLKDATKYDSTLELLEKYGGADNKPKKGKKKAGEEEVPEDTDKTRLVQLKQGGLPARTGLPPPPTANIQRLVSSAPGTPQPRHQGAIATPPRPPSQPEVGPSAEFAPNAFDGTAPPPVQYPLPASAAAPSESHWYDRILDTLLGEDETAAKNRIVLICSSCRLVNGQAPPGTKSLTDVGKWKCMACGAINGEVDEGERILKEALGGRAGANGDTTEDDDGDESSGDLVEVDRNDTADKEEQEKGLKKRKGKARKGN